MGKSVVSKIGFALSIIALFFQVIGFATPYWVLKDGHTDNVDMEFRMGLWQVCESVDAKSACQRLQLDNCGLPSCQRFTAVRAMESLAMIALFLACVMATLNAIAVNERILMKRLGAVISFVGATCGIIGIIVFGTMDGLQPSSLHFSFAFCVIAAAVGYLSGILLLVDGRNDDTSRLISN